MAEYRYPLDLTGAANTNLVQQTRTLNSKTKNGDKFVIPRDAPFYRNGLIIQKVGSAYPMIEGIDFTLVLDCETLKYTTQLDVYGGILFKDRNLSGQVIITMQVVGGQFLQPVASTIETIVAQKSNIHTATWDEIAGTPEGFPVIDHVHESNDLQGQDDVVNKLDEGIQLILAGLGGGGTGGGDQALALIMAHKTQASGAHTPAAIGLGNVPNFSVASFAEAELGVNNKLMTPGLTKYLIQKFSGIETINTINKEVGLLKNRVANVESDIVGIESDINNLKNRMGNVETEFVNVKQEFSVVRNQVSDLSLMTQQLSNEIQGMEATVSEIGLRQLNLEYQFGNMETQLTNFGIQLEAMQDSVDAAEAKVEDLKVIVDEHTKRLDILEESTLYPVRRFISEGTYHFRISPKNKRKISLYGPGGGAGVLVPLNEERVTDQRGDHGTDTKLYLNTDLTNGMNNVGVLVLSANGGKGGWSATQSTGGISVYGKGGKGGLTTHDDTFLQVIENGIGDGGLDGEGFPGTTHAGGKGSNVQGKPIRDGATSNIVAGSGGAGGFVSAVIENNKTFDLVFTLIVGCSGASAIGHNVDGNALKLAAPGLAIIEITT